MRIIAGQQRGKKLIALEGDDVRPTTDRVKEALFNILQFQIEGRCFLDLFSGSGQIGLEALSRGASSAFLVDSSKKSISVIGKNLALTGFIDKAHVINTDALVFVNRTTEKFDVAFLDPPYDEGLLERLLEPLAAKMSEGGIIVCEHPGYVALPQSVGNFIQIKSHCYGKIFLTHYRSASVMERMIVK